jgi:hypothetical protein
VSDGIKVGVSVDGLERSPVGVGELVTVGGLPSAAERVVGQQAHDGRHVLAVSASEATGALLHVRAAV